MLKLALLVLLPLGATLARDVTGCTCDPARPETLQARQCGLCREAEKHPAEVKFFFVKDNNPRKPNRWLILPRQHFDGPHPLTAMSPRDRAGIWKAAIERARSLWGDEWGLAINGDKVRTQCHAHIHIGRLLKGIETGRFIVVRGPAQIPAPSDGTGLWVHPQGNRLHIHLGEQTTETVLFR